MISQVLKSTSDINTTMFWAMGLMALLLGTHTISIRRLRWGLNLPWVD
jgi:hypothetical protein